MEPAPRRRRGSNENCNIGCPGIDPMFSGLRCEHDNECVSDVCLGGFCRCAGAAGCPEGYSCAAMLAGDEDGQGQVCRAAHSGKHSGIRVFRASVCNRGLSPVPPGVEVAVYEGERSPAKEPVCLTETSAWVYPPSCVQVPCTTDQAVAGPLFQLTVDGAAGGGGSYQGGEYFEGLEGNNWGFFSDLCP